MARKRVEIDPAVLHTAIQTVEFQETFRNRTELWKAVAAYLVEQGIKITASVVYLRVKEHNIKVQTPVGKRGGGEALARARAAGKVHRTSKADKMKGDKNIQASLRQLEMVTPERWLPVVEQIKRGSRTAAVKLRCVECCGYQTVEVRECQVFDCSLWAFRPYQGKPTAEEIVDEEAA